MNTSIEYALQQDSEDDLKAFRHNFHIPKDKDGNDTIYFCGNSLGLMPKSARAYIQQELDDWQELGVEGHLKAAHPWMHYHTYLTESMAEVVGALPEEVVVMNSLTVNLHLMMVSFYRPTAKRNKILIDYSTFPSDRYAVESQVKFHGLDPATSIIELMPAEGSEVVVTEKIIRIIQEQGESISLILIGGVNYYTGQAYDLKTITKSGHKMGCKVGFDLAHAAGNLQLNLHNDGPDFAVWCSYKYLNAGPGGLSGCFVHERHHKNFDLPRFTGWWGHDSEIRFLMGDVFVPMTGAEGWQVSNPPIFPMAALRASLDIFKEAGINNLRIKSEKLTAYLEFLILELLTDKINIITPSDPKQRGCQLSLQIGDKTVFNRLTAQSVIADWREPDVIRVAPAPLYNSFSDVWHFVNKLQQSF